MVSLQAQDAYKVKYLGSNQGLSNNSVKCIFQDSKGFVWFGTYDGLDRYDGYEFKILRNRINDSTSLPHNYISALNEDNDHNLWIGMGQGAVTYNSFTNVVSPVYYYPHQSSQKHKVGIYINSIEKDSEGNIFLGTSGLSVLVRFKDQKEAVQIPLYNADGSSNIYAFVQAMYVDPQKRTWIFIAGSGLYRFNYKTRKLDLVNADIRNFYVNKIVADNAGNLWLGTSTGLLKYITAANQVGAHYNTTNGRLSANYITALSMEGNDRLWIGTDGGGVDILNTKSGQINVANSANKPGGLTSESVLTIFIDKESRKWVGTNKGGVNVFDVIGNEFRTVQRNATYPGLSSNFVTSFFEDQQNNLWVGTEGGGVSVWNAERTRFSTYKEPQLSSNTVSSMTQDEEGSIWMATFGGGVTRLGPGGKADHFRLINQGDGFENKIAIRIYYDSKKNLWVTTYETGHLYLYNKQLNRFETFDESLGDLMSIKEDQAGVLWAGNAQSLIRIDQVNKQHQYYEIGKTVRAIYEDQHGRFWVGSEGGGLVLFDRKAGKIAKRYTEDEGLSSNTVMNILEDGTGNLWISTANGLNKFNPQSGKFNRFYESDGLQSSQFSYRAAIQLRSGELAFGGNDGFNIFYPQRIKPRTFFPGLVITSLRVNNKDLSPDLDYEMNGSGDITRLTVPYNEALLSLQFAALEYSAPNKIQYAYYLEGWDKDWNMTGNTRTVTYNNIREGTYTLRIKSTNAEGTWNTVEKVMTIKVLPPWFRTWWAYLLYLSATAALAILYIRYKTRQAKMKYELQLSRVNAEMRKAELESERMEKEVQKAELQKAHAEYEKEKAERETERVINAQEKEINQKRLSFFTNISHEFRTPLTLILNPVKDLIKQYQGQDKEELRIIGLNATRLLSLTDQLLLFRKIEEGAEGLQVSRFDFSKLGNTIFYYFKHEAKTKDIAYTITGIEEPIEMYGDKNKIEIILYNLISNAFKYTPKEGQINIDVVGYEDHLQIAIRDTGAGIPEGAGNAIFDRFYQAEGHVKLGFGIGLYMVKQFTEMHQGTIAFQSEVGTGTVFNLRLPLGRDHFGETPVTEIADDEEESAIIATDNFEVSDEETPMLVPEIPLLTAKKAIIVVDDDEEMRNYVASVFDEAFVVYKASNGKEALKWVASKKPDLVISDISMPEMDGISLCSTIKANISTSHIPVILLTAHTSQEIELKGTEEGADQYVTKPFNKELLLAKVNGLFKSRASLQQYFYNQVTLKKDVAEQPNVPAEYQELLDKCIAIVEKHLDDNDFNIETLAREMGMSHSYLYKRIKLISGQSVNGFIRFLRLRKAAEFLITTNDTVSEVAYSVGFSDVKYFREQFTKLFKMKPTDYIKQYRGKISGNLRIGNSDEN
ncbi:hybrid sensor histidine kinase/response regulator transcription factor [Niabella yanshanensis]|uniref:hybrid sensor histidine kinase/response regulator transcription factor n=1 Tax=Niabella yanshanensis TaxID=577386 RepID=UPI0013B3B1FB|nr:two-component regulator propeller domain-containing protein [Niabella yanshanensis]